MGVPKDSCPFVATTKKVWIPITEFQGLGGLDNLTIDSGGTAVTSTAANGDIISGVAISGSSGAGNPALQEVNTTGMVALKIDAAADDVHHTWFIPTDLDVASDLNIYVLWSSDQTTDTDTVTWKILYEALTPDTDAPGAPATALDTAIAADTNIATADALQKTAAGVIVGGTLTAADFLHFLVEADAFSGADPSTDDINLYGVLLEYTQGTLS